MAGSTPAVDRDRGDHTNAGGSDHQLRPDGKWPQVYVAEEPDGGEAQYHRKDEDNLVTGRPRPHAESMLC
jgi:hypothetical protein